MFFVKAGFIERTLDRSLEGQEVVEPDTESLIRALEKISTVESFDDDGSLEETSFLKLFNIYHNNI